MREYPWRTLFFFPGALPMLLLGLMLLYYRFGKGGSMDDAPAPSEIKKVSKKSLKHQAKKNKVK